jgi:nitrate/nitrite-specific signal transduction histidine kinase
MYLGVVRSQKDATFEILTLSDFLKRQVWLIVILVLSIIMSAFCIFQTSHILIRPLRQLNSKMREILESKAQREISAD